MWGFLFYVHLRQYNHIMGANNEQYIIPFAIDPRLLLSGLDQMDQGLTDITTKAKGATAAITESFNSGSKASQDFTAKMDAGAIAVKAVSDAAKAVGTTIADSFKTKGGEAVDGLTDKITSFNAKLKDIAGKTVDFKFNISGGQLNTLTDQLKGVTGQTEIFNIALAAAKDRLATLAVGSEAFTELNAQIASADEFLVQLGSTVTDTVEKHVSLRTQIRAVRQELAQMTLAGLDGTEAFFALQEQAAKLTEVLNVTNKQVSNLASNERFFKAGTDTVKLFTGSLFAASGALTLLGSDNEELKKKEEQLMGAVFLLNGAMEVYTALSKESTLSALILNKVRGASKVAATEEAVAVAADTAAIEAETVATATETTVKTGFIAATQAATVAAYEFAVSLATNPLTAIVAVLAAAAAGLIYWLNTEKQAVNVSKEFIEILELESQSLEKVGGIVSQNAKLKLAQADIDQEDASKKTQILIDAAQQEIDITIQTQKTQEQLFNTAHAKLILDYENGLIEQKDFLDQKKEIEEKYAADQLILTAKIEEEKNGIEEKQLQKEKQLADEANELANNNLHQLITNAAAAAAIREETRKYASDILTAQNADLKDGQQKELNILEQATKDKLDALDRETVLRKKALDDQNKQLALDEYTTDPEVFAKKQAGLAQQEALEVTATKKREDLKTQIVQSSAIAQQAITTKYAEQLADNEFAVNAKLLSLEKEFSTQKIAIIEATAAHEQELVERSNLTGEEKFKMQYAIELQSQKDIADVNNQGALDAIDLQNLTNKNLIDGMVIFKDDAVKNEKAKNVLIAQEDYNAAAAKLDILIKNGTDENTLIYQQTLAGVEAARKGVATASAGKKSSKNTWADLLGIGSEQDRAEINQAIQEGIQAVQKLSNSLTATMVANAQKQVDAAKAVVAQDDSNLQNLQSQLSTEMALRNKGVANNVDGVNKEIAAQTSQRAKDLASQQQHQKELEKVQRAQILINSLEEASQLALAISKLFATNAGVPVIGVPTAIALSIVLVAAFVAEKVAAISAVGATTMAKGGLVKGKSHAEGGQKFYSPDSTAGVVELEADEFVTSKKQTEKFLPLLQVINDDNLTRMDERALVNMLGALGVHLQTDSQHREAISESKEHTTNQINQINVMNNNYTPAELISIDKNLKLMLNRSGNTETITEEGGYIVTRKGNYTKRVKK